VEILGLGIISNVLVSRRKWDLITIAKEIGIIFRKDKQAID
jgi:hypothetical protein